MLSKACELQSYCLNTAENQMSHIQAKDLGLYFVFYTFDFKGSERCIFLKRQLCFEPVRVLKDDMIFSPVTPVWFHWIGTRHCQQICYLLQHAGPHDINRHCKTALANNLWRLTNSCIIQWKWSNSAVVRPIVTSLQTSSLVDASISRPGDRLSVRRSGNGNMNAVPGGNWFTVQS